MRARFGDRAPDSLDQLWDAMVLGLAPGDQTLDTDGALLQRFHALDVAPGPSPAFVERLEQQLAVGWARSSAAPSASVPAEPHRRWSPPRESSVHMSRNRWMYTLAAVLTLLFGGLLAIWLANSGDDANERVIPAVTVDEPPFASPIAGEPGPTLLSVTIDPAIIGATGQTQWNIVDMYVLQVPPGNDVTMSGPDSDDQGMSTIIVTEGTLEAESAGRSLIVRATDGRLIEQAAGTPVTLQDGDAWIVSMTDAAVASNTTDGPAAFLRYALGTSADQYFDYSPAAHPPFAHDVTGPTLPNGPIRLEVQELSLAQDDTIKVVIGEDDSVMLLSPYDGAVRITRQGTARGASTNATSLGDYPPGTYTITRELPGPAELYLARWTSAAPASNADTPTTAPLARVELLNSTIDPAAIDITNASDWNYTGIFTKSGLLPGQEIVLDGANWGAGLSVTTVFDGTLDFISAATTEVQRAGDEVRDRVEPGETVTLQAGDAVFYDGSRGARFQNIADTPAEFLTLAAFDVPEVFFPDVPYPPNLWGPKAPLVDLDMTQKFQGPVVVTVEQVTLAHGQALDLDIGPNDIMFLSTADGSALQFFREGSAQSITTGPSTLHDKGPGHYTITRAASAPADILVVRMTSA